MTVPPSLKPAPLKSEKHGHWNRSLLNVHPEFAAGLSYDSAEGLSHNITAVSNVCDPSISTLFDLGHATEASGKRTIPIAAVACGESGSFFALLKVECEVVNLEEGERRTVRIPCIGHEETGMWIGSGAPVRQIRFARPVKGVATWMAVRFPQVIIIFRPLYHEDCVPTSYVGNSGGIVPSPNSHLDANPMVKIPSSLTGGYTHADVTFNPWNQTQIGIIDDHGNWSIWDVSTRGRPRHKGAIVDCVKSGSLPWLDDDESDCLSNRPRYDGWAAIEWVGDANKLIVCDRRCIVLYQFENDHTLSCPIELGLRKRTEWILDIKRSPQDVFHLYILTTSRIFWLDVKSTVISSDERNTNFSLSPRLYQYHFRDDEDITLCLASLLLDNGMAGISISRKVLVNGIFRFPAYRILSFEQFNIMLSVPGIVRRDHACVYSGSFLPTNTQNIAM
jgi:RNA polymerase I-specific transcription initiation factor RRN6